MKKIIALIFFILGNISNAQLKIDLEYTKGNKIKIDILSNKNLQLMANLNSTNLLMNGQVIEYPMYNNNTLYFFVYNEIGELVPQRNAFVLPNPDKSPSFYKKDLENREKQKNIKYNIRAQKKETIYYSFLIFKNQKDVFKALPCKISNCSYDYYSLEKGKKYKIQVQLQHATEIYKSNIVEFTY